MQNVILANTETEVVVTREIDLKRIGFIYAVENGSGSLVKIGKSKKPKARLATLRTIANATGRSWVSELLPDCSMAERLAHKMFSSNRVSGEWFSVDFEIASVLLDGFNEQSISEEYLLLAKAKNDRKSEESLDRFFARWKQIDGLSKNQIEINQMREAA